MSHAAAAESRIEAKIVHDPDAESPREWDNLGIVVELNTRRQQWRWSDESTAASGHEYLRGVKAIALPVFKRWGGGLFAGEWGDSFDGADALIYVTRERVITEYGSYSAESKGKAIDRLKGEIEVLSQWAQGDVYGYVIESVRECECCGQEVREAAYDISSVWGFYGDDPRTNGMLDHVPEEHHQTLIDAYESGEIEY